MYYAFNTRGKCVGAFTHMPSATALTERSNVSVEKYDKEVKTKNLIMEHGELIDSTPKPTTNTSTTTTTTTDGKTT